MSKNGMQSALMSVGESISLEQLPGNSVIGFYKPGRRLRTNEPPDLFLALRRDLHYF